MLRLPLFPFLPHLNHIPSRSIRHTLIHPRVHHKSLLLYLCVPSLSLEAGLELQSPKNNASKRADCHSSWSMRKCPSHIALMAVLRQGRMKTRWHPPRTITQTVPTTLLKAP
jgi:hypothetical protein